MWAGLPGQLAGAGETPHRIVLRFLVVRRTDVSGGFDEPLLHYFMRDLNYGYRDLPFVFVQSPDIVYIDDDALYANIPDWPTALGLLAQHHVPGVVNNALVLFQYSIDHRSAAILRITT